MTDTPRSLCLVHDRQIAHHIVSSERHVRLVVAAVYESQPCVAASADGGGCGQRAAARIHVGARLAGCGDDRDPGPLARAVRQAFSRRSEWFICAPRTIQTLGERSAQNRRYTGDRRSPSPPGRITPDTRVIITQSRRQRAAMITRVSPRYAQLNVPARAGWPAAAGPGRAGRCGHDVDTSGSAGPRREGLRPRARLRFGPGVAAAPAAPQPASPDGAGVGLEMRIGVMVTALAQRRAVLVRRSPYPPDHVAHRRPFRLEPPPRGR